jgi:nucleoside-diphosphate-sugar epimerase
VMMPGVRASAGEMIAALRRVAGDNVAARIRRVPDLAVSAMVAGWPAAFDTPRALALGFAPEHSFDDIIRTHIADDLGGAFVR